MVRISICRGVKQSASSVTFCFVRDIVHLHERRKALRTQNNRRQHAAQRHPAQCAQPAGLPPTRIRPSADAQTPGENRRPGIVRRRPARIERNAFQRQPCATARPRRNDRRAVRPARAKDAQRRAVSVVRRSCVQASSASRFLFASAHPWPFRVARRHFVCRLFGIWYPNVNQTSRVLLKIFSSWLSAMLAAM